MQMSWLTLTVLFISNGAIDPRDKVHLQRDREADFASSIADALRYLVNK